MPHHTVPVKHNAMMKHCRRSGTLVLWTQPPWTPKLLSTEIFLEHQYFYVHMELSQFQLKCFVTKHWHFFFLAIHCSELPLHGKLQAIQTVTAFLMDHTRTRIKAACCHASDCTQVFPTTRLFELKMTSLQKKKTKNKNLVNYEKQDRQTKKTTIKWPHQAMRPDQASRHGTCWNHLLF